MLACDVPTSLLSTSSCLHYRRLWSQLSWVRGAAWSTACPSAWNWANTDQTCWLLKLAPRQEAIHLKSHLRTGLSYKNSSQDPQVWIILWTALYSYDTILFLSCYDSKCKNFVHCPSEAFLTLQSCMGRVLVHENDLRHVIKNRLWKRRAYGSARVEVSSAP